MVNQILVKKKNHENLADNNSSYIENFGKRNRNIKEVKQFTT